MDFYLGMFTSIVENGSELFIAAESPLLTKLELRNQPIRLGNMMSRKKDILPWFGEKPSKLTGVPQRYQLELMGPYVTYSHT